MGKNWKRDIEALENIDVQWDKSLSRYTTLGVGGKVSCVIYPLCKKAAGKVIAILKNNCVPYLVIGRGSNLLIADKLPEMAAISIEKGATSFELMDSSSRGVSLRVGAGITISRLMRECLTRGIQGLEFLAGIPGTVGGAIMMNAGTSRGDIAGVLKEVTIITDSGARRIERNNMVFSYRKSNLPEGVIIWDAIVHTRAVDKNMLRKEMIEILRERYATQPGVKGTAGSIFKNPPGNYAGRLIEEAGLKGKVLGDAKISEKHANWIVTTEGARADDVYGLLKLVQKEVKEKFGIELEPEIKLIGFE